jgi:hypothetical protein
MHPLGKPLYITYQSDLYQFNLDSRGNFNGIYVTRGNESRVEEELEPEDIPRAVLELLNDKLIQHVKRQTRGT